MNIESIRQDYPILNQDVNDEPLIYFDNAATSQTPNYVIDTMVNYYHQDNANIHRGVHCLAQRSTDKYEDARAKVAKFINAQTNEIIFNRGTSEGLNFLVRSLIEPQLKSGQRILTTRLEHHSSIVPVQELCQRSNARLEFIPLDSSSYQVDLDAFRQLDLNDTCAIVIQQVSNVLGVEQPIEEITKLAHKHNVIVIVDGAQAIPHQKIDVKQLGIDGYCFSGHKMYGPTGIGVCYLNEKYHSRTVPLFYGGEMIHYVGDYESNYKDAPWKFEAGTMPISQVIGLGSAVDYLSQWKFNEIKQYESELIDRLYDGLSSIEGIQLYQDGVSDKHGIVSFNINGIHPHDAASAYDLEGIAIRAGHHCCQPLMRLLEVEATLRASICLYNTMAEVEHFITVTEKVRDFFYGTGTFR